MWQRIGASRAAPCGMLKLFGAVLPMAAVGCMVGDSMTFDDPGITVLARCASDSNSLPNNNPLPDGAGTFATVSTAGNKIDLGNEFFQDLGANGRRCVS